MDLKGNVANWDTAEWEVTNMEKIEKDLLSLINSYITTYKMGSVGPNTLEGQFLNNPPL